MKVMLEKALCRKDIGKLLPRHAGMGFCPQTFQPKDFYTARFLVGGKPRESHRHNRSLMSCPGDTFNGHLYVFFGKNVCLGLLLIF